MKNTGDKVVDTVLANFRSVARSAIQNGRGVNLDDSLERAIAASRYELKRFGYSEQSIRERIWAQEESIVLMCKKCIVEIEKKERLTDIRKTSIESILDEFAKHTGLSFNYYIRGNNTVRFIVGIPQTKQYLVFCASFSKILSQDWIINLENDIREFITLSSRFGKIKVVSHN